MDRRFEGTALRTRVLPCLGWTLAGLPDEPGTDVTTVEIPDIFGEHESLIALEVIGESMVDEHILPGDLVVVQRNRPPRAGDVVVVQTPDGWTLKRWYPGQRVVRLVSGHPDVPDRWYPLDQVEVYGVVVGVLRKYR